MRRTVIGVLFNASVDLLQARIEEGTQAFWQASFQARALRAGALVCLAILLGSPVAAQPSGGGPPGTPPSIDSAEPRLDNATLAIAGTNFGTAQPIVTIEGVQVAVLSYNDTQIVTALPMALPKTYRLTVTKGGTTAATTFAVSIEGGDITTVTAGFGLTGGAITGEATLGVNTDKIQARVAGVCPTGSSMREIDSVGNVVCEAGTGGDITAVAAGTGLSGGGTGGDVAVALDTAFTDARYAPAAHGHTVSQVSGASTLGANTFSATQTIDTGNIDLDRSTATTGNVTKNGELFLHNFGQNNTFLGITSGNVTMSGASNTAVGDQALRNNVAGSYNTAHGHGALRSNNSGSHNTATGKDALTSNTTGVSNTATGFFSLRDNTTGSANTAYGHATLTSGSTGSFNTAIGTYALSGATGNDNVAVGQGAGSLATTGSNNIYLGSNVSGVAGESNTMYLGKVGTHVKTVIAGIRGAAVSGGEMVVVDASGRVGSTPISTATGDITGVSAGSGLTGGGAGGDVALALDTAFTDGRYAPATHLHTVNQVSGAASLGTNRFTATQTVETGNLVLDPSTASAGNITKHGTRFLHNFGGQNVFLGANAGNFALTGTKNTVVGEQALSSATTGGQNTAIGQAALFYNTSGAGNTATGNQALTRNTTGSINTAIGREAMFNNESGSANSALGHHALMSNIDGASNTAMGAFTLRQNTTGASNTGVGYGALSTNTAGWQNTAVGMHALLQNTGNNNVALGTAAGANATTGRNNIYLGAFVEGIADESNTIYIGNQNTHRKTVIAGIRGITTLNPDAIPVVIDSAGQLGTLSSSSRFKEDVLDMGDVSRRLFQLRPVTFRYTQVFKDGSKPIQYGLVAEEVAEVFPELAVRDADGTVETVHYEKLSVLLLNELQQHEQALRRQRDELRGQRERIEALEQKLNMLVDDAKKRR